MEEWKLTFLELKELAIAAGLTHCIIPEGEPIPSTAPCDMSDSESSSGSLLSCTCITLYYIAMWKVIT